jgi:phenylacetate-CoA ligase
MDKVRGRVSDIIRLPDGSCVSGEFLTTIFDDQPELVRQFQVHQRADLSILVNIVPGRASAAPVVCIQKAQAAVRALTRDTVPVTVELVEAIPHDRGKLRFIISDVARVAATTDGKFRR